MKRPLYRSEVHMKRRLLALHRRLPLLHEFLSLHIKRSGLTHREIAQACGFKRANVVSMIKLGHTKLPLERLGSMARVLELDTFDLYCRFMEEYYPETWVELRGLIPGADPSLFDS
jgi:hypothetical protein